MKKTKLILTRAALMSLFVILCAPAWAEEHYPNDHAGILQGAIITFDAGGRTVVVDTEDDWPSVGFYGNDIDHNDLIAHNWPDDELWMTYTGKPMEPTVVSVVIGKGDDAIDLKAKGYVGVSYTSHYTKTYPVKPSNVDWGEERTPFVVITLNDAGQEAYGEGTLYVSYMVKKADLNVSVSIADAYANLYYPNSEFTGPFVLSYEAKVDLSKYDPNYYRYYNGGEVNPDEFVITPAQFANHTVTIKSDDEGDCKILNINSYDKGVKDAGERGFVYPQPIKIMQTHKWDEETRQWVELKDPYDVTNCFKATYDYCVAEIKPLPIELTIEGNNLPGEEGDPIYYDGKEHTLEGFTAIATPKVEGIEEVLAEKWFIQEDVLYKGEGDHVSLTDAGKKPQDMKEDEFNVENPNFDFKGIEDIKDIKQGLLVVSPLPGVVVSVAGAQGEKVYNGEMQSVNGWRFVGASTDLYTADFVQYKDSQGDSPKTYGTQVNTYPMNLNEEYFSNTSNNFEKPEFHVTEDGWLKITPLVTVVTVTGNQKGGGEEGAGDYVYFDDALHTVTGYTWKADNDLYKEADFTFSGEAKVQSKKLGKNMMKLKASQFENTNKNFDVTFDTSNDGYLWITYYQATLEDDKDNTAAINKVVGTYASKADVTVKRTFAKGQWNTVCLPFDVTIADSPLAGAEVLELDAEETTYDAATGALSLNFVVETPVTVMEAGKPYVIKFATDHAPLVFKGAEFSKALQDVTVDLGEGKAITFKGTYKPVEFEEANSNVLLVGEGNKLFNPAAHAYVNPQRAYFELTGFEEAEEAPAFVLNFGGTTNISNVNMEKASNEYFDLSGRRVAQPTEKGIYIMNGKKVVVK